MNRESNAPLAIVGIGCLFPKAAGPGFYWANVKNGVDCIDAVPATHWNPDDYFDPDPKSPDMTYARRGGFLSAVDFNPMEFGVAPRDLEATDTSQLLGLVAAKQALNDAGVDFNTTDRNRVSVILGVTGTLELVIPLGARLGHPKWKRAMKDAGIPDDAANDAAQRIADSYVPWQENSFPGLLGNVVAGRIANKLDLGGTNCAVDAACASSLSAVHLAALELQAGRADVVVSGGIDTFNDIFMYMCFSKTPALSPTGDAKPFDADGDGTILGEGLGVVVLKRLADAERDGDAIYAVLKGIGSSSDGKGNAIYAPSPEGQKKAIRNAYRLAGVTPDTIELVEAHGTGTRVGDTAEITALTEIYSSSRDAVALPISRDAESSERSAARPWVALGSVKSQIGHTKAAAGAASLIKVALALHNKVLPPTLKVALPVEPLRTPDTPFYVNAKMRPWLPRAEHPRRAVLSAFGFGGSNFHAVLEEYRPEKAEPDWDGTVEIAALAADSPQALLAELQRVPTSDWSAFARFAEASRSSFQPTSPCRLTFAAHRDRTDLVKLLAGAKSKLQADPAAASWHTPDGVHYGSGSPGKLAVLFPGQGSQYVGMLRELACLFPEFLDALAIANGDGRLSDRIYPPTSFDAEVHKANDRDLRDTRTAQPAIGAVSVGAWRVLHERFGLAADCFAGHSYGELTALAASGRIGLADLFGMSRLRGELMARPRDGDSGSMLAVLAPLPEITAVLTKEALKLVVANRNAPQQHVLSGATAEIERAATAFNSAGMKCARLPVSAAFHSEFVAEAAEPFRAALEAVRFTHSDVPVFANTTAGEYPSDASAAKDLLANQLAKPVAFVDEVQALAAAGVRTFVEVGPSSVLTRLVESIIDEAGVKDAEAFALDSSGGKRSSVLDLGNALARLAARGVPLLLDAWEAHSRCQPPALATSGGLTFPICGANYVSPRPARPPRVAQVLPMSDATNADPNAFAQALLMTQQSLAAFQRMQEQTAQLHKQFLESQESAQRTLQSLVEQQQSLLASGLGSEVRLPVLPPVAVSRPPTPQIQNATPPAMPVPPPQPKRGAATAGIVESTLLAVVAEKTGYPISSLDLKLSLDSDLGVDSIKRVEILSALQEKLPQAPQVKPEHLGTLHTLQDVADFLNNGVAPVLTASRNGTPAGNQPDIATALLAVVAEKTGYPIASLDLKLSLDSDLGVDSIKRVEILSALQEKLPHAPQVKPEDLGTLHTLQDVADFLSGNVATRAEAPATVRITLGQADAAPPDTEQVPNILPPKVAESVQQPRPPREMLLPPTRSMTGRELQRQSAAAAVTGDRIDRSILQAVDLDPGTPRPRLALPVGAAICVVGEATGLAAAVAEQLIERGFKARLVDWTAAEAMRPTAPLAGLILVAPLAPTPTLNRLAFEWLQRAAPKLRHIGRQAAAVLATVARLDGAFGLTKLTADADPTAGGLAGLAKTARHEWPEVACKAIDLDPGFADPLAAAIAVVDEVLTAGPMEVGITMTHRCTLELARTIRRAGANAIGLGARDVVLVTGGARGVTAEVAIALAETYGSTLVLTGRTPPPGPEPAWLAGIAGETDLKRAIAENLGPAAAPKRIGEQYQTIAAQREVRRTLQRIAKLGRTAAYFQVDVADRTAMAGFLKQVRDQFGPVTAFVHGAGVLADRRIEDLTVNDFDRVYSTKVDGLRIGLDLLAGEELKAIVVFSSVTARFGRTGQLAYAAANEVLNKTAQVESRRRPGCRVVAINWGPWDGGMVTPGLRKQFESEGVGLIPLADGAAFLIHELNAAGKAVEVLALGKPRVGSSVVPMPAMHRSAAAAPPPNGPIVSPPNPVPNIEFTPAFERTIDIDSHPILRSHVLDGRAVLPLALHLEFLAHAALHGNPGLHFHGFNDLRITHAVKLDVADALVLKGYASKAVKRDKLFVATVELRGKRNDGRELVKSRAEIVLASALPAPPTADRPPAAPPYPHSVELAYREYLFHGPDLHGLIRIAGASELAFLGTANPAPPPSEWFFYPLRSNWIADPLVLDVSFQMMCLWSRHQHQSGSLPNYAGRYRQFRRQFPTGPTSIVVRITRDNGTFARADIDYLDADGAVIAQLQDYECVIDKAMNLAYRRNQLDAVTA